MTNELPPPVDPPTAFVVPPPPTEPPAIAPKKPINPILAALLGLAVGAGLVGGAWAYTGRDTAPDTFTLIGTFTLTEGAIRTEGENCRGNGGYDDIARGTSVTVYNAAGEVAATGSLGESEYSVGACAYIVTVDDVPKGEKFYQVEVSHRGKVQMTAEEAEAGKLAATLG
ncbi:hypothetical protein OG265_36865 (plasmid) [Streptomyces sp. NBC_01208]|uniref:hypothetical protein n=1 Tax=Streptomyces sp. NBC_01208 TaxID=2903773 RepID=UPI002E138118|nr:hypothetical protein OG265_36865 [Streptomyces sp. NBC_01208]